MICSTILRRLKYWLMQMVNNFISVTQMQRIEQTTLYSINPIPYIKGTSETISWILQPYNIRVAHKPTTKLRHLLTNIEDRDEPNNRQGAVYKIKSSDCQAFYIGETGRNLNTNEPREMVMSTITLLYIIN